MIKDINFERKYLTLYWIISRDPFHVPWTLRFAVAINLNFTNINCDHRKMKGFYRNCQIIASNEYVRFGTRELLFLYF